ncbi:MULTISPECIES: transporter substrate-binding domain-containing protein [Priestia]|uniref:ABC transporter substrate-binding protein n=2 Tax=Priestia TaxID=2800373 RepID=A0A0V8JMX7_9BACI|nr:MULTISPECIES: transporter substrate-binding domain-containing protein [Priestia]KSU88330.1 ABC transporter substrate-binding protein [Priestia veravalensis]MBY6087821.1 transporter substrate-binding domain-containing protein [Priestia flexa]MCA1202828.1 transporter substrate-binding domain-containing protein [Priestia flexa]MCG7315041.1 transporter substrate-binding domain-containing protein [Priestia flexa]MCM3067816.1 transporter substrate-binding domain-containing protein [Priestia flexa
MKRKAGFFLTLLLSAVVLLAGCGQSSESASGSGDADTFTVGLEAGYPPFNWTQNDDSNGAVKIKGGSQYAGGYDVEMAKKIADGLGKELVIVKTEWDGLVPALTSGKIDAIVAGMSPTAERKETIDFSDNYYNSNLVMVVKKGSKYEGATKIADFKGAKITAQLNTFHYSVIDQIKGVSKETAMDNFPAMRVALESGVIDGYVSERPEAVSASAANDNFAMVEFKDGFKTSADDTAVAVGLKKDSELKEEINKILKGISEEERTSIMDAAIKNQPAAK